MLIQNGGSLLTLYGDGVRDDTTALQALFDGERVWSAEHGAWQYARPHEGVNTFVLTGKKFKLTDTIKLRVEESDFAIEGGEFVAEHPTDDTPVFLVENGTKCITLSSMTLRNVRSCGIKFPARAGITFEEETK